MDLIYKNDGTDVKEWIDHKMHLNGVPVNVQLVKNDTCECVRYELRNASLTGDAYDSQESIAYHEHPLLGTSFEKCEAHTFVLDHHALQSIVREENHKKNRAWEEVKSKCDPAVKDKVTWEFDTARTLIITLPESEKGKNITTKEAGVIIR